MYQIDKSSFVFEHGDYFEDPKGQPCPLIYVFKNVIVAKWVIRLKTINV